jgi:hypothetical protein
MKLPAKPEWPKYDPRLGACLCQSCWNNGNWSHHCTDKTCDCFKCHPGAKPKKLKLSEKEARVALVAAGQLSLPDTGGIVIAKEATYVTKPVSQLGGHTKRRKVSRGR